MALIETEFIFAPRRIPRGLGPAVEGLAREILRHRPRDVYAFAARHFERLIELREKGRDTGDTVSTITMQDCQLTREGHDRVLDWTRRDRDDQDRSKGYEIRLPIGEIGDFVETTKKRSSKLSKKRRNEETRNRSGWSVDRTVKVLKRYERENDIEKRNAQIPEKTVDKEFHEFQCHEQYLSRPLKNIAQDRSNRSSSVGDILAKPVEYRFRENQDKFCARFPVQCSVVDTFKKEDEFEKNYGDACAVKRQRSADRIERRSCVHGIASEGRCDVDLRKSRSLADDGSERNESSVVEVGSDNFRSRRDRLDGSMGNEETRKRDLETMVRGTTDTVAKSLNVQPNKEEPAKEKEPRRGDFVETNVMAVDREVSQDAPSVGRCDCLENSVHLPLVTVRPSSNGYTRTGMRNVDAYAYPNEPNDRDNDELVLPPIDSSDVSKSVEKKDNVILPSLSKTTEIRSTDRRVTTSHQDRDVNIANAKQSPECKVFSETRHAEITNYDSVDTRRQILRSNATLDGSEDDDTTDVESLKHPGRERQTDDEMSVFLRTAVHERPTDETEMFEDSLNVTPDSVELIQRSDLSERSRDADDLSDNMIDGRRKEEHDREELRSHRSNELKNKLIEIELVEKSIENTLCSSETVVRCNNDEPEIPATEAKSSRFEETNETIRLNDEEEEMRLQRKLSSSPTSLDGSVDDRNGSFELRKSEDNEDIVAIEFVETPKTSSVGYTVRADLTNIRTTMNEPLKDIDIDIDLSCYVLTDDSSCRIPESVTTVIIPNRTPRNDDDNTLDSERESTENDSYRSAAGRRWQQLEEQFQYGKEFFGEHVSPRTSTEYSTNIDSDFLNGIKNATDRTALRRGLRDIQEEEEIEKETRWDKDERFALISDDVGVARKEKVLERTETTDENTSAELTKSNAISSSGLNRNDFDDHRTISPSIANTADSASTESCGESVTCPESEETEPKTETAMLRDSSRNRSDTSEPFVPELNLDSLRDATVSSASLERNDSINCESRSNKENDNDVTFRESEQITSSFDTLSSKTNAIIDKDLSLKNESFLEERRLIENEERLEERLIIDFEDGKRIDARSCRRSEAEAAATAIEEEIAKELIRNMTLETSKLIETDDTDTDRGNRTTGFALTIGPSIGKNPQLQRMSNSMREEEKIDEVDVDCSTNGKEIDFENARSSFSGTVHGTTNKFCHFAEEAENAKNVSDDENIGNETLNQAVETIRFRMEKIVLAQRSEEIDEYPKRRDFPMEASYVTSPSNLKSYKERTGKFEMLEETMVGTWLKDRERDVEANRINASPTTCTSLAIRETGGYDDPLPLPTFQISRNKVSLKFGRALPSICETPNLQFSLEPDLRSFDLDSPRPGVLCVVNFPKSFCLIENELTHWPESYARNVLFSIIQVKHALERTNALTNDATHFRLQLEEDILSIDPDDLREPLALIDDKPKSILIEEISNIDEKRQQSSSNSGRERSFSSSFDDSDCETDFKNTERNERNIPRNESSIYEIVRTSRYDLLADQLLNSPRFENDDDASKKERNGETNSK
ncbi:uncharacterized protein LOC143179873 [Calliopsis andreniformis]|uniref:uncharacterized protein LOC143179873 n=1 Tax=Calliopsis andreniformis TaxID=337506 RepID=UPI003FCD9189